MQYNNIDALNWTLLSELLRSPKHLQHRKAEHRKDTDTMRFGRALHCAVLEPDRFLDIPIWTGTRRAGAEWNEFKATLSNGDYVTREELSRLETISQNVRGHPIASQYLREGTLVEHTLTWVDSETGLHCKARLDAMMITPPSVIDLKSTRNASLSAFPRDVASYCYHGKMAFYAKGMQANGYDGASRILIAIEHAAPYDVVVYQLDAEAEYAGDRVVSDLMRRYAECKSADKWPGYSDELQSLALPRWALPNADEQFEAMQSAASWLIGGEE